MRSRPCELKADGVIWVDRAIRRSESDGMVETERVIPMILLNPPPERRAIWANFAVSDP